jgi:hypothetical protein
MKYALRSALLATALIQTMATALPAADIKSLVKKMDELFRSRSSYAEIEMEIVTPDWQRTLVMKAWSKGQERTLVRILEPKKEAGVGSLRLKNEMWNFLPKTDKVIKIPPSMMMSSWMGSDLTNDDMVKEYTFVEDFAFQAATVANPEPGITYIECRPKEGRPIIWDKIVIAMRDADELPVWEKCYDEKGTLVRIMQFSDVRSFGARRIPAVMELIPQTKPGQKTVIRYRKAEYDIAIDDAMFSLRQLQSPIEK